MYFLERKETYAMPNILGNHSMPAYTYRWKAIAACESKEPLLEQIQVMDQRTHRITNNMGEQ